jgi:hypothetical protein
MGCVKQAILLGTGFCSVVCVKFSKGRSGKGLRLVHKRPEGEVAAAGAPQGKQLRRWR